MISTVTTTAVSLLDNSSIAGSFTVISMLVLAALLVQKEVISAAGDSRLQYLSRVLNVAILPLMLTFVLIVVVKIIEALS